MFRPYDAGRVFVDVGAREGVAFDFELAPTKHGYMLLVSAHAT